MPRCARVKKDDAIFHIMVRSISEVDLFKNDDDKKEYLFFIKEYQKLYKFRVYSYCLMDNHAHMIIDANGADISRIMHGINFTYAGYFNSVHKRHGHLFQDRFKSKMILTDKYMFSLSAYIHNNPSDLKGFKGHVQDYYYSSLGIYLGMRKDPFELIEDGFVLSLFGNTKEIARENYMRLVLLSNDIKLKKEMEFENEKTEYRSQRTILVRDFKEQDAADFVAKKMGTNKIKLHMKYNRKIVDARALLVLLLRSLCNSKCSDICRILGNITQSRVSKLCSIGLLLIDRDEKYRGFVEEFIECYS